MLTKTVSSYLQEEYLASQINEKLIKTQFAKFGIEEKYFPAYLDFWKQVYNLESNEASLTLWEGKKFTLYADKKLITHPNKFRSIDDLDNLFSFERTIDFEKSDPIFNTLFWNTPQAYIVDDTSGGIIDTINYENDIPIYLGEAILSKRLLLDKKSEITVTDKRNPEEHKQYTWFPHLDDEDDTLQIIDKTGNTISIEFEKNDDETNPLGIIDTNKYDITATKRTFTQPANPPLITQLIQTAVFNEMVPKDKKIPMRSIEEQSNMLDSATPVKPYFDAYVPQEETPDEKIDTVEELEKEIKRFTSYRFASTQDIPKKILQETGRRFHKKKPEGHSDHVKAWIDKGEIFFHKEYFCKTHNLQNISHEAWILTFTLADNTKVAINEISTIKANPNLLACIQDLKSAKVHEIAHRLFEFHDINNIDYPTTDTKVQITLDQETLCEIADGKSLPRKHELQSDWTKRRFVLLEKNGMPHKVWLDELEKELWKKIEWFSRKSVKAIDAAHLDEYQKDYEKFADLVVANTTQSTTPPTVQTVNSSRQAMSHRLTRRLEQIDEHFDPSVQSQVEQRANVQQHLDTLTQQETTLNSGTPTQNELNQMHQQQVEAAQFLQQSSPSPRQGRTNTAEQGNTTQANNRNGSNPPSNSSPWNAPSHTTTWNSEDQGTQQEHPQEWISSSEEEKNKFDAWFALFKGDVSAKLENGSAIFLKENISDIPWRWFNRVKYTIVGLTDETISLEMSDASEKQVTKKSIVSLPRTESSINKLKKIGKGEVYKFWKAVATKSWCIHSMKQMLWNRSETDGFNKTISDKNSTKKEAITHVWVLKEKMVGSDRTESIVYKVDWWTNYVTVSSAVPDGDKNNQTKKSLRTKKMDYDTFQMFCFTKDLNPLTKTEVTRSGNRLDPDNAVRDGMPAQWISLAAIWKWLKAIPEAYKKKFEEEQEFQTALATDWLSNLIPNTSILFLDEIKNDLWGTDGLVRQRIQKFKSERSATWDSDKASIHDNPISENIKSNVFENIQSTRKYKYKAAGALLYALEKWGPYFRALSEYANKDGWGRWVKCILWEDARQQFIKERQRKIDQYKSNGGSSDSLQSEIVKLELQFIENGTKDKPGRWSKFWREIEDHKDKLYGWAQSIDPSWFSKKWDFAYMYDAFRWWGIGQNLPWVLMSSLEAMKSAVEEGADYNTFYMCIMMIFATGMVHMLPKDYLDRLKGIWRSRGIPITLLATDAHASGKAMRILDHIARNAWIKTFSEFSWHQLDMFDALHIHNYAWNRNKIRNSFANWRSNYGWTVMDAFNYKNDFLIDIPRDDDPSLTTEQKKNAKVATNYLWPEWVFGGYKGIQDQDSVGSIDGQSPFFQEWILNLSEGSFRSYMMQFNQGQLINQHSASMWSNFAGILEQFETNINSSANEKANHVMTQLLYKKFIKFFERELGWSAGTWDPEERKNESYKSLLEKAIRGEISLEPFIRKSIFKEKDRVNQNSEQVYVAHEDISDKMVQGTIMKFAELIKKSYKNLKDPANKADIFSE
jgi:hypothetical protein